MVAQGGWSAKRRRKSRRWRRRGFRTKGERRVRPSACHTRRPNGRRLLDDEGSKRDREAQTRREVRAVRGAVEPEDYRGSERCPRQAGQAAGRVRLAPP